MPFLAGASSVVINPDLGSDLCGQLHRRRCERIRDDLEANLLYLADGKTRVLLVSLDLIGIEAEENRAIGKAIAARTRIPARNVILCSTHTHAGPVTFRLLHDAPVDPGYIQRLRTSLVEAAARAVASSGCWQ